MACGLVNSACLRAQTVAAGSLAFSEQVKAPPISEPAQGVKNTASWNSPSVISEMCAKLSLETAIPTAKDIWENARTRGMVRIRKGANALGFAAAVVFLACKLRGVPRTPKELRYSFFGRFLLEFFPNPIRHDI